MDFEFDSFMVSPNREICLIYFNNDESKRCIGHIIRNRNSTNWTAYANGDPLTVVSSREEGAQKLWELFCIQHPAKAGLPKKDLGECTVEERLARIRRRIPQSAYLNDSVLKQVRDIPIDRRQVFIQNVDDLLDDLEQLLSWWRKASEEAKKSPKLKVYFR
ncbi:hypothetical protein [Paenibacillus alkalitolerans]|uniref:hypothetical protein n=1 Tax=Paenibacillus alkalitolerans TaxID=2799335 RepID=UPI0018F40733|nr:hypothetical protein [Paenibacillus alkalitolerans]